MTQDLLCNNKQPEESETTSTNSGVKKTSQKNKDKTKKGKKSSRKIKTSIETERTERTLHANSLQIQADNGEDGESIHETKIRVFLPPK